MIGQTTLAEPVMKDLRAKRQEAEAIRNSKLTNEAKEEKLTAIDKDITELQKQAQTIRKQNMKKEGRKNFDKHKKDLVPPPCKH